MPSQRFQFTYGRESAAMRTPITVNITPAGRPDRIISSVGITFMSVFDTLPNIREGSNTLTIIDSRVPGGKFVARLPEARLDSNVLTLMYAANVELYRAYWAALGVAAFDNSQPQFLFSPPGPYVTSEIQGYPFMLYTGLDCRTTSFYVLAPARGVPTIDYAASDTILCNMLGFYNTSNRATTGASPIRDTHLQLHLLSSRASCVANGDSEENILSDCLEVIQVNGASLSSVTYTRAIGAKAVYSAINPLRNVMTFVWKDARGVDLPARFSTNFTVSGVAVYN